MVNGNGAASRAIGRWPASSVLGMLDGESLQRMLALGTRVRYAGGRSLIRQGDLTTHVLVLTSGVVKATVSTRDGAEVVLAIRMGGDLVGEFAAADAQPRSATVTACGAVEARSVPQAEYLDCLRHDPRIAAAVHRSLIGKVRAANMRRVDFTAPDILTRVARALHDLALSYGDRDGNQAVIRFLTQPELARLIGAAESSVHKALRDLRGRGIAEPGYGQLRILDLGGLSEIAQRLAALRPIARPPSHAAC